MTSEITRGTLIRIFTEMHEAEVFDFFTEIMEARGLDWVLDTGDEDEDGLIGFPHSGEVRSPYEDTSTQEVRIVASPRNVETGADVLVEMFPFRRRDVEDFLSDLPALLYHPVDGKVAFKAVTAYRLAERLRQHGFVVELPRSPRP